MTAAALVRAPWAILFARVVERVRSLRWPQAIRHDHSAVGLQAQLGEPKHAARLAREAAAVREYAHSAAVTDPRFAADLIAAADRHEQADKR